MMILKSKGRSKREMDTLNKALRVDRRKPQQKVTPSAAISAGRRRRLPGGALSWSSGGGLGKGTGVVGWVCARIVCQGRHDHRDLDRHGLERIDLRDNGRGRAVDRQRAQHEALERELESRHP